MPSEIKSENSGNVYYPWCLAEVVIMFEEQVRLDHKEGSMPASPEELSNLIEDFPTDRVIYRDEDRTLRFPVNPAHAELMLNPYDTADSITLILPLYQFPFDPNIIRAGVVKFYMGTMNPKQYSQLQSGKVPIDHPIRKPKSGDFKFYGVLDDVAVTLGKPSQVKMTCRDFTSVFINSEIPPSVTSRVSSSVNFANWMKMIMNLSPVGRQLSLELLLPDDHPLVANGNAPPMSEFFNESILSLSGSGSRKPKANMSIWDYIVYCCSLLSLKAWIFLDKLYIAEASTIWGEHRSESNPFDVFRSRNYNRRKVKIGKETVTLKNPMFVYGLNATPVTVKKSYLTKKTHSVEAVSWDQHNRRLLKARWPIGNIEPTMGALGASGAGGLSARGISSGPLPESDAAAKYLASNVGAKASPTTGEFPYSDAETLGRGKQEKYRRVMLTGINDQETLLSIAKAYFESSARQEIQGSLETAEMASVGGDNSDPDILRIFPGTSIDVVSYADTLKGVKERIKQLEHRHMDIYLLNQKTPSEIETYLKVIGFSDKARIHAAIGELKNRSKIFTYRVKAVKHTFSPKRYKCSIEFLNYVVVRLNPEEATGVERPLAG